jgi:hypothetical protein
MWYANAVKGAEATQADCIWFALDCAALSPPGAEHSVSRGLSAPGGLGPLELIDTTAAFPLAGLDEARLKEVMRQTAPED